MLTRVCTKCGVDKTIDCFSKAKLGKYGVKSVCKCCVSKLYQESKIVVREKQALYYRENKAAILRRVTTYRNNNKELIAERKQVYALSNKEKIAISKASYYNRNKKVILENNKIYRQSRKEQYSKYLREWGKQNRDKKNAHEATRRAVMLLATVSWANNNIINALYSEASQLTKRGVNTHVDHIVPLQSDVVCGLHCEANLQLLPASDNISKSNRWWPDMW